MVNYLALYPHCDPALFPGFELPIRYSYSTPYIGNMQGTDVPPYPGRVAAIHTHGAESAFMLYGDLGSRVFSEADKKTAHEIIQGPFYLATPYGELLLYYPDSGMVYERSYRDIPWDPYVNKDKR